MKFVCTIADANSSWTENYDKPQLSSLEAVQAWAEDCVRRFNESLHPFETPRRLVSVALTDAPGASSHTWEKTSLVTQRGRGGLFDAMRCKVCRITGKRFNLNTVIRDPEYKAKGFASCAKSIELLKKRAERSH